MNKPFEAYRIFNGTHTAVWIDSVRHYEAYGVSAKVTLNTESIQMCGAFMEDTKTISGKGEGAIELYKTDSSNIGIAFDPENPDKRHEIVFKVDDPAAIGAERIRLIGVHFTETTLAAYQAASIGRVTLPFTFADYKLLESVAPTI